MSRFFSPSIGADIQQATPFESQWREIPPRRRISLSNRRELVLEPVSPSCAGVIKKISSIKYSMDVLSYYFIRPGLTRAKALQTAHRFPKETRRRFAVPKTRLSLDMFALSDKYV